MGVILWVQYLIGVFDLTAGVGSITIKGEKENVPYSKDPEIASITSFKLKLLQTGFGNILFT